MASGNELQKKRYYFLKLPTDWFGNARIKKLRRLAGGDTLTIIYLKLMLLSANHDTTIIYEGFEDDIAEELAIKLDENPDNIKMTLAFLKANGLAEMVESNIKLIEASMMVDSHSYGAIIKQRQRSSVGQITTNVQPSSNQCPTDIDKEKDIERELINDKQSAYERAQGSSSIWAKRLYASGYISEAEEEEADLIVQSLIRDYNPGVVMKAVEYFCDRLKDGKAYDEQGQPVVHRLRYLDNCLKDGCARIADKEPF